MDVWAAAASLYHMLTGAYPRDFPSGKDPWQVVLQTGAVPIRPKAVEPGKRPSKNVSIGRSRTRSELSTLVKISGR